MHTQDDLPHFLRDNWEYPSEVLPPDQRLVQVRTTSGRVTVASLEEDGRWVESLFGRERKNIEVRAWRRNLYKLFEYSWSEEPVPLGEEDVDEQYTVGASEFVLSFEEGRRVTVMTCSGHQRARDLAADLVKGWRR